MNARSIVPWLLWPAFLLPASAQQVLTTVPGFSAGDRFGAAVIDAGDVNGDGVADVLVGAPGRNGGTGAVYCVSGHSLGTGSPAILWIVEPNNLNTGAGFGSTLAAVGNLTGTATPDYVVGAPGYVPPFSFVTHGAVFLVDGSSLALADRIEGFPDTRFGHALVAVGDQTGDFKVDLAVTALENSGGSGKVHIVPSSSFAGGTQLANLPHWTRNGGWTQFGAALASGFDLDGDGLQDLAIGSPDYGFNNPGAGYMEVLRPIDLGILGGYTPPITGAAFGSSISASHDYNGDGVVEIVVGSPKWSAGVQSEDGRVAVLSGARLLDPNAPGPLELYDIKEPSGVGPAPHHFGAAVRACPDLNGDGVGDFLVGAPDYHVVIPMGPGRGAVSIYSGATGAKMGGIVGANHDRLGDALGGAIDDLDGDGFPEIVFAGSSSNTPTTDCGTLKSARLFPAPPGIYCTAKVNSQGCSPLMSWNGSASASSASQFLVTCANAINQQPGLLYYAHAPAIMPFQGGFQCVKAPVLRTAVQGSGGTPSGTTDCSGAYAFDFNARIQSGVDPTLVVGAEVFCQYWSRDPQSPSSTSLSNALRFLVNP